MKYHIFLQKLSGYIVLKNASAKYWIIKSLFQSLFITTNLIIFALQNKNGELAHLARALAWQARGDRFESGILHNIKFLSIQELF